MVQYPLKIRVMMITNGKRMVKRDGNLRQATSDAKVIRTFYQYYVVL
jgi:hypothetical protein